MQPAAGRYLKRKHRLSSDALPPLHARLTLAAAQMLSYSERFDISSERFDLYVSLFEQGKGALRRLYRHKVQSAIDAGRKVYIYF